MSFTTISFIVFFATLFFAYYAIPKRFQWWLLLAGSVFFYGFTSPYYLIFLFVTIGITYSGALCMSRNLLTQKAYLKAQGKDWERDAKKAYKAGMERKRRWMLIGIIAGLLVMLGAFKYGQFFVNNVVWLGGLLGWHVVSPALNLILPLGLSFYIFQSLGYCIDVQREEVIAERNFFKHALYVSFFPQVLQGPIGNYSRLAPQLFVPKTFDYQQAVFGLQRIAWGFFKKLMIANITADRLNACWADVTGYTGLICWLAILFLYAIQLYADFSGYMDISCGCAQMLGIRLDENFSTPYFSKTIAEFWRKWHITLGVWFKDYVFYPLLCADWNAGLRRAFKNSKYLSGTLPTISALLIVWTLIGLWHGADWSYLVYGLYHGGFIMISMALAPVYDKIHSLSLRVFASKAYALFQMLRTFVIVMLGYSLFKPASLITTGKLWCAALSGKEGEGIYALQYTLHHSYIKVFVWIALILIVDVWHFSHANGSIREKIARMPVVVRWALYIAVLWVMIFYGLYGSGFDQFEYFKF